MRSSLPAAAVPAAPTDVSPPRASSRLRFIDAARGATMLFVLVSHFGLTFFDGADIRGQVLETVTLIASPTFMIVSGLLVGFLYRTRPSHFARLRMALLDRGLFLLTVGHLLILCASWPFLHSTRYVIITDAIGVSMIVSPVVVQRVPPAWRVFLAAGLYVVAWTTTMLWHPASGAAQLARDTLFGTMQMSRRALIFPIVPWWCLDLAATALGERLGRSFLAGDDRGMGRLFARTGAASLAASLLLKGLNVLSRLPSFVALSATRGTEALRLLTSPRVKFPPSPAYFLFYGGLGLIWVSLWLAAERRGRLQRITDGAVMLGQASLFVFLLQFFVYFTIVHLLRPYLPFAAAWPLYLLGSMCAIVALAREWHRRDYRRFVTVGLRARYEHGSRFSAAAALSSAAQQSATRRLFAGTPGSPSLSSR